jgi:hypothetical protein
MQRIDGFGRGISQRVGIRDGETALLEDPAPLIDVGPG